MQNRLFQSHWFYNDLGVEIGRIIPSVYDVYDTFIDNPFFFHIFNSHYSEQDINSLGGSNNDKYILWFVWKERSERILARFEGHIHLATHSGQLFTSGAMFNGEYNIVEFYPENCTFYVKSINTLNDKINDLGYWKSPKCPNLSRLSNMNENLENQKFDYETIMIQDYQIFKKSNNTKNAVIVKINNLMSENNQTNFLVLPISYTKNNSTFVDIFKFSFNCTLNAINYATSNINKIVGSLKPINQNRNILNVSNEIFATLKLVPNSNHQLLQYVGNEKGFWFTTNKPIMEMFNFNFDHNFTKREDNFGYYTCI